MKIFYVNDEQKDVMVRVLGSDYDPALLRGDKYVTLKPSEGRTFEFVAPDNSVPYIKKWKDLVLISFIDSAVASAPPFNDPTLLS